MTDENSYDVVLIGAGIMSATLGTMLKQLEPGLRIGIFEMLEQVAKESTDGWNNAGTGHSAFCELNYTPQSADGSINIDKAVSIATAFENSKAFWSYLVEKDILRRPQQFINAVPHLSFVWGEENISYLKARYEAMVRHPLFAEMKYSEDAKQLHEWMPLMMQGRPTAAKVAATYMEAGTDVNFGCLTRQMFDHLKKQPGVSLHLCHEVKKLKQQQDKSWKVKVRDNKTKTVRTITTSFLFIGAGGAALTLLKKSGIPEGRTYGGFPVSGQWLICRNKNIIDNHHVKVYGKALVGTPPMSVPHLDTRILSGKKHLLFGPYAGFTTKFLKRGSPWDLIRSITFKNIGPMISAGLRNFPLTKYLFQQVTQSPADRLAMLHLYVPTAKAEDWVLQDAGQRVQIIKKGKDGKGVIEFGTELVTSADGTLAALLGASPGASVAPGIMVELLARCFRDKYAKNSWEARIRDMLPLTENDTAKVRQLRMRTDAILQLEKIRV